MRSVLARHLAPGVVLLAVMLPLACAGPAPAAFHYDSDACDHCRMTISNPAFAAQLVTQTGKIYRFDDPGCLRDFLAANRVEPAAVHSMWVNDHAHPDARLRVEEAWFVVSGQIRAPMNGQMAAFARREDAEALQASVGGRIGSWADVAKRAQP